MRLSHHRRTRVRHTAVLLVIALLATMVAAPTAQAETAPPVRVIVELSAPAALAELAGSALSLPAGSDPAWQRARSRAQQIGDQQRDLVRVAAGAGVAASTVHQLTATFNGIVMEVPAGQVDALRRLPGVRAVHRDQTFSVALDDSVPLIGTHQVWENTDPDGEQVTGAGQTVAIIDTGIDYTHPDLGGGFGLGHKVVGGYDFVNDDPDPMDDHGHGTHVAGIVAADGQVRGVAPGASLTAYKVLDQFGSGQLSGILAALDHAAHPDNPHRADVVNMSLSGAGDGTDPLSVAANAAAEAGIVVVAAAGNFGPGPHTVGSPAAARGVLAVGASASGVWVPRAHVVAPLRQDLRAVRVDFSAEAPAEDLELDLVDVGQGLPGSYDHIDVAGRAVLMEDNFFLGRQVVFEQALHAQERGAAAVFFHVPQLFSPFSDGSGPARAQAPDYAAEDAFPVGFDAARLDQVPVMTLPVSSALLLQQLLADGEVRVEVGGEDATDLLANFSSRGPTGSFTLKPELVAPGVEILSTLPGGEHARSSGTSMAAPHVAGAAALLRQSQPGWEPSQVGGALANSAEPLDEYPPLAQGAGRLDLVAASDLTVVAEPAALSLGLADLSGDEVRASASLTLTNLGTDPADLTFAVEPHSQVEAEVTLDTAAGSLAPGADLAVELTVNLGRPAGDTDITGWLRVDATADGATDISVPYLLSVRYLNLHVTPDPATTQASTEIIIRSPALLAETPTVTVECPGLSPQAPELEELVEGALWQGTAHVADAGLCAVHTTGTGVEHLGSPSLDGEARFEVADAPVVNPGQVRWQPIGPHNEAGWFAFSDHRHRVGVVSHRWASLFVSEDRMDTWRELRAMPVGDGIPVGVEVDPRDRDTMYVGVNGTFDRTYQGQVLLTTDHGDSWRPLPGRDSELLAIALDGTGRALAVADDIGVRITPDRGETWHDVPGNGSVFDLHWIGSDLHIAGTDGLVRVPDASSPAPGGPQVLLRPGVLGWAERVTGDDETLLVSSFIPTEVHASTDGGETFEVVLQASGTTFQALELIGDTAYAVQAANLWVSPDRGTTWEPWGTPVDVAVEIDVGVWPSPHPAVADRIFVSSETAGIYAADEPGSFQRTGIPAAEVYSLVFAEGDNGQNLVAGTERDSFHTVLPRRASVRPEDFEWQSTGFEGFSGIRAQFLDSSPADPSVVFKLQTDPGPTFGIYRSQDGGETWQRRTSPTGEPISLLVHPADPDMVYAGFWEFPDQFGVVMSEDGGETWRKVGHDHLSRALAGHPTDPDVVWAGGEFGLFRSDDGGMTFHQLSHEPVTALAVHPDDPQRLAVGGRALYLSTDGGVTLEAAEHVDVDMWVTDVVFAPDGSQRVFAATTQFWDEILAVKGGRGVLASHDGGRTWTSFTEGLTNPNVNALAISADGRYLYAGTLGGGVHRVQVVGPSQQPPGPPGPPR